MRIDNILSAGFCDACTASINTSLARAILAGSDHFSGRVFQIQSVSILFCHALYIIGTEETGFGNVDSKHHRWDMYLDYSGVLKDSVVSILGDSSSALSAVFHDLFDGEDAQFHEFAALISDEGASSQRVHSDTTFQPNCPLYTVFVAMQDVVRELGPTLFIQGSHTVGAHSELRHFRERYLSSSIYHQALLKQGDVVIMDSRTCHCGDANDFGRRILLYFTLLNPKFEDMGGGSKFENLHLNLHDIIPAEVPFVVTTSSSLQLLSTSL